MDRVDLEPADRLHEDQFQAPIRPMSETCEKAETVKKITPLQPGPVTGRTA
jgi:hypothetical protein